jgi:hypothetical protein
MARSDGSLAPVLWVVGGPQLKIGAPGSNSTAVVRFQDTTPNVMMEIDSVLSSVNYPVIVPAVTGSAPAIIARGTDTNIDAKITPKGTGAVIAGGSGLTLPGFATGSLPTASAHTNTLAWDTTQAKPTYSDGTSWTAVGSGSSGVAAAPAPLTGNYFYPISSGSTTTNTMPNGFMYAVPFRVETAFTITRLGGDVTVIGDTGSKDPARHLLRYRDLLSGHAATGRRADRRGLRHPPGDHHLPSPRGRLVLVRRRRTVDCDNRAHFPPSQRVDSGAPARARFDHSRRQHAGLLLLRRFGHRRPARHLQLDSADQLPRPLADRQGCLTATARSGYPACGVSPVSLIPGTVSPTPTRCGRDTTVLSICRR